jgi:hypothetical protein
LKVCRCSSTCTEKAAINNRGATIYARHARSEMCTCTPWSWSHTAHPIAAHAGSTCLPRTALRGKAYESRVRTGIALGRVCAAGCMRTWPTRPQTTLQPGLATYENLPQCSTKATVSCLRKFFNHWPPHKRCPCTPCTGGHDTAKWAVVSPGCTQRTQLCFVGSAC